ncbi:MAG: stage II sporulation protein M [Thaumarchaeota archaeon]|nr:MAG: stage II sporulation protein M [Nitrososphaerota archaeon]
MSQSAREAGMPEEQEPQEPQQQQQPQQQERQRNNLLGERFGSRRVLLFLAVLLIELTIFFMAMAFPLDPTQQQSLYTEGQQLVQSVNGGGPLDMFYGIFLNNVRIALIEAIPFVGPVFLGYSIFYTGEVLQAFAVSSNPPVPPLILGAVTFVFPHALIEFAGYAVAVTASVMLVWAGIKKRLRAEIRVYAQEVLIAGAILFVAAATETIEIVTSETFLTLVLWVPIAIGIVVIWVWLRRVHTRQGQVAPTNPL